MAARAAVVQEGISAPSGVSVVTMSFPAPGLVPVHIGQPEPGSAEAKHWRHSQRVPGGLDWQKHGLTPRWIGMETSDCAAALEPGFYANTGADERDRYLDGTRQRHEVALVVTVIGDASDSGRRSPLSHYDSSVNLSDLHTSVDGRRVPKGAQAELAPALSPADRDLGLRLRSRPPGSPWWSLHLSGSHWVRGDGSGETHHEPQGKLQPILVDGLGEPLVAAWIPPSGLERWYVVPDVTSWDALLAWLVQQAMPEYVPSALRRARSPHFADPDLLTTDELAARNALADLEAGYAEQKMDLERTFREAKERAEPVRYGLLYGTGGQLVQAVAQVMADAGLRTIDLDEELGATKSADLLVNADSSPWRLVEVKSASGAAPEQLVSSLQRHLATWPELRPEPVTGGSLIVNHQHRLHPSERTAGVYARPEFVNSLSETVVSTVQLFYWWRAGDWPAIRTAILGASANQAPDSHAQTDSPPTADPPPPRTRRRRWRAE
jgi:hypothetical protein